MERWQDGGRDRELTLLARADEADCFEAICRPTLTFPCALVKIIAVTHAETEAADENKSKHRPSEEWRRRGQKCRERVRKSKWQSHKDTL